MDYKALLESGYELFIESGFTIEFNKSVVKESLLSESKKGALVITLPVCKLDTPTANGRIYSSKMMESAIAKAQDALANRRLLCSADDHPSSTHVPPIHSSHAVVGAWVKDGMLWNKWEVTETTNGKNLRALIEGGFSIGTSIRGLGRLAANKHVEDYNFLGTDGVGNPAAGTYALPGSCGVTVEFVENLNESKESLSESRGLPIPGVGHINQNGVIKFRGQTWRVSNIAGSPDQFQMTLYSLDPISPSSLFVMSSDMANPSREIEIIKEGSEELKVMDKLTKVMESVKEAADKLHKIRESNDVAAEMRHIAAFEYSLSQDSSLSGSELKRVQEEWDKEKTKKIEKVQEQVVTKVPVELQIEQLNKNFSDLTKMVESVLTPLKQISEEEQKMIAVMKSAPYTFDNGTIEEVLTAFLAHPDNEKMFHEELITRLGSKATSVDLSQLFKDITVASGNYQQSGAAGQQPNYLESVEQEKDVLEKLVKEFCDRVESGSLLDKDEVVSKLEGVVTEARAEIRRHQVREALVTEMLVETILETVPVAKKFRTYHEQFSKLWESSLVIIHQLREELNKNKVVVESIKESVEVPKIKQASRVPGWK